MDSKKTYLTKEGLGELKKECEDLINVKRPDVLSRVSQARNMGDLSENAEYTAAREELTLIDTRIDELEELLKQVILINERGQNGHSIVKLGSKVTVEVKGKKEEFAVVGEMEANPEEKKISHKSPIGSALLGKKVGEKVEVEAPAGKITYAIVSIN